MKDKEPSRKLGTVHRAVIAGTAASTIIFGSSDFASAGGNCYDNNGHVSPACETPTSNKRDITDIKLQEGIAVTLFAAATVGVGYVYMKKRS